MSDEELVGRLRRMLAERADAYHPGPGQVPAPPGRTSAAAGPDGDIRYGDIRYGDIRDEDIRYVTAPLPVVAARRRWIPVAAGAALAAAAAAIAFITLGGSGSRPATLQPAGPSRPAPSAPAPTGAVAPAPSATPTTPPTSTAPVSRSAGSSPVAAGFAASSATFVSASEGWALGFAPCGTESCAAMAVTHDGGRSWAGAPAPRLAVARSATSPVPGGWQVRFADGYDGWVYGGTAGSGGAGSSQLWSTHDGGRTWTERAAPGGPGTQIFDLEASGGTVYLVTFDLSGGAPGDRIWSSPAGTDDWAVSPLALAVGAGPVPQASIVLFGARGWVLDQDRTVIDGARLNSGKWERWAPPCRSAQGAATLAADSPTGLDAVCAEGSFGPPEPGTVAGRAYLFVSGDGGDSFARRGALPAGVGVPASLAVAPGRPGTVLTASGAGLVASFDGGVSWSVVYPAAAQGLYQYEYAGFTTADQGVAVLAGQTTATMLMTRDGGHTWSPVRF